MASAGQRAPSQVVPEGDQLSPDEIRSYLGLSPGYVPAWVKGGQLQAFYDPNDPNTVHVPRASLEELLGRPLELVLDEKQAFDYLNQSGYALQEEYQLPCLVPPITTIKSINHLANLGMRFWKSDIDRFLVESGMGSKSSISKHKTSSLGPIKGKRHMSNQSLYRKEGKHISEWFGNDVPKKEVKAEEYYNVAPSSKDEVHCPSCLSPMNLEEEEIQMVNGVSYVSCSECGEVSTLDDLGDTKIDLPDRGYPHGYGGQDDIFASKIKKGSTYFNREDSPEIKESSTLKDDTTPKWGDERTSSDNPETAIGGHEIPMELDRTKENDTLRDHITDISTPDNDVVRSSLSKKTATSIDDTIPCTECDETLRYNVRRSRPGAHIWSCHNGHTKVYTGDVEGEEKWYSTWGVNTEASVIKKATAAIHSETEAFEDYLTRRNLSRDKLAGLDPHAIQELLITWARHFYQDETLGAEALKDLGSVLPDEAYYKMVHEPAIAARLKTAAEDYNPGDWLMITSPVRVEKMLRGDATGEMKEIEKGRYMVVESTELGVHMIYSQNGVSYMADSREIEHASTMVQRTPEKRWEREHPSKGEPIMDENTPEVEQASIPQEQNWASHRSPESLTPEEIQLLQIRGGYSRLEVDHLDQDVIASLLQVYSSPEPEEASPISDGESVFITKDQLLEASKFEPGMSITYMDLDLQEKLGTILVVEASKEGLLIVETPEGNTDRVDPSWVI